MEGSISEGLLLSAQYWISGEKAITDTQSRVDKRIENIFFIKKPPEFERYKFNIHDFKEKNMSYYVV